MIRFLTKAIHKCSFCGRETEGYKDVDYYTIDIYWKRANTLTNRSTENHVVEKTMCDECYNKLKLYLTNELTNKEDK